MYFYLCVLCPLYKWYIFFFFHAMLGFWRSSILVSGIMFFFFKFPCYLMFHLLLYNNYLPTLLVMDVWIISSFSAITNSTAVNFRSSVSEYTYARVSLRRTIPKIGICGS